MRTSVTGPVSSGVNKLAALVTKGRGPVALEGIGFRSFSSFKRARGPAGKGLEWHHIVEQTKGNVNKFGAEAIHNTNNLMRVEAATHRRISGYYSSIQDFTGGQTVRNWLSNKPIEFQREFGLDVLKRFGVRQ